MCSEANASSHTYAMDLVRSVCGKFQDDARASINTPNIGSSTLIIEELDWECQKALNTCENSLFGPHLGLGKQKNVVKIGQIPDVEPPY